MNREGIAKHWELVEAFKNGADIQFRLNASEPWIDSCIPIFAYETEYRIKPPGMEVIDLSVLIESGIDCEFSCHPAFTHPLISTLVEIRNGEYWCPGGVRFDKVRPRMNHIHYWGGGARPLPGGFEVEVTLSDETTRKEGYHWGRKLTATPIIGFEVLGITEGYCYPWEEERDV